MGDGGSETETSSANGVAVADAVTEKDWIYS